MTFEEAIEKRDEAFLVWLHRWYLLISHPHVQLGAIRMKPYGFIRLLQLARWFQAEGYDRGTITSALSWSLDIYYDRDPIYTKDGQLRKYSPDGAG